VGTALCGTTATGAAAFTVLHDGRRSRAGLRCRYGRKPVLQRSGPDAVQRQRIVLTVRHLPGRHRGGGGYTQYGAPYVATWIVQYKRGPLAITPALQFFAGARYGVPGANPGIDPTSCTAVLASATAGDPRYPYGGAGGSPYDATNCGNTIAIPDTFTGKFDNLGAFVEPNQVLLHTQISYDVSKRLTLVANFANIVNRCWGGSNVPWGVSHACTYTAPTEVGGGFTPTGNVYNPGFALQPQTTVPYAPTFPLFPFTVYVEARLKL
jgi:hypothetical protein